MKFSELSKNYHNFLAPAFVIEVQGKDLLKEAIEVFGVTVNLTLEGASDFSFTVNNPFKSGDFEYLKKGLFTVGSDAVVKYGYGDHSRLTTLLVGLITEVEIRFPTNGISQLSIKGFDLSHKMMKEKISKNWGSDEPIKYSDIVKKIAGRYSLSTSKVEDTGEPHRQIKQDRESDYDFIKKKLAEKIGFEVFVFEKELYFRPPANDKKEEVTSLKWRRELFSFAPRISLENQIGAVEVRGWDPATQKPIIGKAERGQERGRDRGRQSGGEAVQASQGETTRHFWRPVPNQREADDLAKSILDRLSEGFVTGNGECIGLPEIQPGKNIELTGLGKMFSKIYYIEKATHTIGTSGYKTTFSVKENTI
jgi:phage protein D